jgi:hypothetical protein
MLSTRVQRMARAEGINWVLFSPAQFIIISRSSGKMKWIEGAWWPRDSGLAEFAGRLWVFECQMGMGKWPLTAKALNSRPL